jgi:hypothetical protein
MLGFYENFPVNVHMVMQLNHYGSLRKRNFNKQ